MPPLVCVVDDRLRPLDATLETLPLHRFEGDCTHLIREVTPFLEQSPTCPGIVVMDRSQLVGMVSRQQILEWLINPGTNLFEQPLAFLIRMTPIEPLVLSVTTPLLEAAQQLLRRPKRQQSEPIIVRIDTSTYRLLDSHSLLRAAWQVRDMEIRLRLERSNIQMIQTEKMSSLGRLVNGVAHEILDPVGFIWGNLCHISDYTQDLLKLIRAYEGELSPLPPELADLREEIELDYLQEDLPKAIASIQSGADRLKTLASSLQTFCYIDEVYPKPADLHHCLDSIVFLLETQLSGEIEVIRDYGYLPPVTCYIGQLNQVFTNILSNAVQGLLRQIEHAVSEDILQEKGDDNPGAFKPCIRITTQVWTQHFDDDNSENSSLAGSSHLGLDPSIQHVSQSESTPLNNALTGMNSSSSGASSATVSGQHRWVSIQISDNGPGLSPQQLHQIQDSFAHPQSTRKETSLDVSHRIVAEKHDGKILVQSPLPPEALPSTSLQTSLGQSSQKLSRPLPSGTEFQILLPIQ